MIYPPQKVASLIGMNAQAMMDFVEWHLLHLDLPFHVTFFKKFEIQTKRYHEWMPLMKYSHLWKYFSSPSANSFSFCRAKNKWKRNYSNQLVLAKQANRNGAVMCWTELHYALKNNFKLSFNISNKYLKKNYKQKRFVEFSLVHFFCHFLLNWM